MKRQALMLLGSVLTCTGLYACGDLEEKPIPPTTTTGSSSSSSSSSSSGEGGSGSGSGGGTTSSSNSSSGMGGMGGSGGTGGSGGSEPAINACTQAMADDYTTFTTATIQFNGFTYYPACIRVKTGTDVTFEGAFGAHPLQGGTVVSGVGTPDPTSPIQLTNMGMSATFKLNNAGVVPYYCTLHTANDMMGAIFVEP